jgi:hypothetical protein
MANRAMALVVARNTRRIDLDCRYLIRNSPSNHCRNGGIPKKNGSTSWLR